MSKDLRKPLHHRETEDVENTFNAEIAKITECLIDSTRPAGEAGPGGERDLCASSACSD